MFINRLRRHTGLFFRTHAADLLCLIILTGVLAFIVVQNRLPSGGILMGWDNLNPEFNLGLNLKRSLISVWQEYQGLGLLAGHGHTADLPRQLILAILSLILPTNLLRWSWVMAMLAAGAYGVYALLRTRVKPLGALLGSLFAITNLGTLQIFYTPFEPFVTQFGTVPWLLLAFLGSVRTPKRTWFVALAVVSFLAAPQGFVQTVFFATLLLLAIVSLSLIVEERDTLGLRVKRILASWGIVLAMNAFWLLPSIYFITVGSRVAVETKINQMSTEEVYLRNRAFGTLWDTVQLKGFWFDTFDFDPTKSAVAPIYGFWRAYAGHPVVEGATFLLFAVILVGAAAIIVGRTRQWYWLLSAFVVLITLLTLDTPPFSWVNDWLSRVPLFHQAYRIRFTKIASLASIIYSLLFGVGSALLLQKAGRVRWRSLLVGAFLGMAAGSLSLIGAPAAAGNLFYPVVVRSLPQEYADLFSYFQKRPATGRIAILPQPTYWGWKYYAWGYTGWGFLWYGIENPILDRAFDPWSGYNENYYWELSRSIYSKDVGTFDAVLAKYDVRYILFDENIISPSHNRALFTEEIKAMLASLPKIREAAKFGKLTVYERWIPDRVGDDVTVKTDLPLVSPSYRWTDNDVAYRELGDYIIKEKGKRQTENGNEFIYPFRSLFTKRSTNEREFSISDIPMDELVYDSTKSADLKAENVQPCGVLRDGTATAQNFDQALRFTSRNQRGCLSFGATDLPHRDGYLVAVESRHITGRPMLFSLINQTAKHVELETYLDESKVESRKSKVEDWQRDYFILPPLANDGLGYTVYLSNDAIGRQESINDIKSIKFYRVPYQELVMLRSEVIQPKGLAQNVKTLVLSQAYDPGWTAWEKIPTFPYLRQLKDHVLVNNWSNGWSLPSNQVTNNESTIILFFLPQLLQWIGFLLLPIPFLVVLLKRNG